MLLLLKVDFHSLQQRGHNTRRRKEQNTGSIYWKKEHGYEAFSEPFHKIFQIWFLTLFYFFKWISCHRGACQEEFISGICCRTLGSILVVNKNSNVIKTARRHSRRWTLMRGCHVKHYRETSLLVEVEYLYMAKQHNRLIFLRQKEKS